MTPPTKADRDALRALLAEGTERPWVADLDCFGANCEADDEGITACVSSEPALMLFTAGTHLSPSEPDGANWARARQGQELRDARLIAAAVNALPGLLDRIDALEAELADAEEKR